jgi:prevent-host-death family protein
MDSFNVHEAKTHFSKILAKVQAGEEVVIAKAGRPIARVVPIHSPRQRVPGRWRGQIWIAGDFDAPLPDDLLDAFEGKS